MHKERRLGLLEYGKLFMTLAALVGFLLFTGAPRVRADESECQHRTEKADHRLHEAVEHHGWDSKQAEHARHELKETRQYCWEQHHKWWDSEGREWRSDHTWDDDHGHRPH
jgi:hypothetical protein